jgi:hypothetical protein
MAMRSGGSGVGGGCSGGGAGSGGGRRTPGGDEEEERHCICSIVAKKRTSRWWTNWGRTPPPSLAPYAVGARTAQAHARDLAVRLSPPPASWDVGEASSSASAPRPIVGRRRGDLEEEADLTRALAESTATAAAKKRREEEAAAAIAVKLFKPQEELEAHAWALGDDEVDTGEGDAEAEVILVDSD